MKIDNKTLVLFLFISICLAVELIGSWFTKMSIQTWYPTLMKPNWTLPSHFFGPIWTFLYVLMGISVWLIWDQKTKYSKQYAFLLFTCQLLFNLVWPALFFGLRNPLLGLVDLAILGIIVLLTMISFYRIRPLAALLLVPYFLWTIYALALNFTIWNLNR